MSLKQRYIKILYIFTTLFIIETQCSTNSKQPDQSTSAKQPSLNNPQNTEVITADQIEILLQQANTAAQTYKAQPTQDNLEHVAKLTTELYNKAQKCKELDEQVRNCIHKGNSMGTLAVFVNNRDVIKCQIAQRRANLQYQVADIIGNLKTCYQTLPQEATHLRIFYPSQPVDYALDFNQEGWTPSLHELADYRPELLAIILTPRVVEFSKKSEKRNELHGNIILCMVQKSKA